jgi:DNA polymerase-3 subunit alpha
LFQRGETVGVFQFESAGMQRNMRELQPTRFDDLIAMNALYRPGPMQFIPSFIRRKNGEEKITYLHPKMESALGSTYGILVYQEQFMQISKDLAGFTGGQADYLRKAVGKKKMDMMLKIKPEFINGALTNNPDITRDTMEQFWSQLEEFANYCFNKSHAACYAMIAYWTAYLKAHYPAAFMAALMTSDANNTDRLSIEIAECNRLGLKVMNPDVNESFSEFAVVPETGNIRFGLNAVKNVGTTAIDDLINQRDNVGKFTSVEDFARRVNSRVCNRKVLEALIKAGAFDGFKTSDDAVGDRSDLLFSLDNIIAFAHKVQKDAASGQGDLFEILGADARVAGAETFLEITASPTKISEKERLAWERELLGLYLSSHPLDRYDTFLREQTHAIADLNSDQHSEAVIIGGILQRWRTIQTKSGSKMVFAAIEDKTGEIETVIFPKLFETLPADLDVGPVVQITGRISGRDRDGNKLADPSVIADTLEIIDDETLNNYKPTGEVKSNLKTTNNTQPKKSKKVTDKKVTAREKAEPPTLAREQNTLYVHIKDPSDGDKLVKLKEELKKYPGDDEVILVLGADKKDAMRMPFGAEINDKLLEAVGKIYAANCVAVK